MRGPLIRFGIVPGFEASYVRLTIAGWYCECASRCPPPEDPTPAIEGYTRLTLIRPARGKASYIRVNLHGALAIYGLLMFAVGLFLGMKIR